jgi:riboflavin kinase/FMN adenylyltransferase
MTRLNGDVHVNGARPDRDDFELGRRLGSAQSVAVVGEFDGFHAGHRMLLDTGFELSRRERLPLQVVIVDDPCLRGRVDTINSRRAEALAAGADDVHVLSVESSMSTDSSADAAQLIADLVHPAVVLLAALPGSVSDARYPTLRARLHELGLPVVEVPRAVGDDGVRITSARVREAVMSGQVAEAARWLARPFTRAGIVVHGQARGRTIGFPTANVVPPMGLLVPQRGVYAARVSIKGGTVHVAALNVGVRPTVERDGVLLLEAHLLDFDGDLYGQRIRMEFHDRIRDEVAFDGIDSLVAQLRIDVETVRDVLTPDGLHDPRLGTRRQST